MITTESAEGNSLSLFEATGIEIEYMIVDNDGLDVLAVTDHVLAQEAGEIVNEVETGKLCWSNELVLHVIELKTNGPAATLSGLANDFTNDITRINARLDDLNARLMPTAMHPWMDPHTQTRLWPHGYNEIYETYNKIFDCRGHGWSNLQSMHINLPFAGDDEFHRLHTAIRALMPILPALAASSPVVEWEFTGLMDTRMEVYRHNSDRFPSIAGLIIPEYVTGRQSYSDIVLDPMFADIAPFDMEHILQFEWLNSRGAIARFDRNAIEIRVLDTQETPAADIAIAGAIINVLKKLTSPEQTDIKQLGAVTTEVLSELFLENIRTADKTVIRSRAFLELFEFPGRDCQSFELWYYLLDSITESELDTFRPVLDFILERGCLARRIKDAAGQGGQSQIREVYRKLTDCLAEGELFEGI